MLIEYLSADDKFNLLNKVRGQKIHTYNRIENVQSMFERIWNQLIEEGVASEKLGEIHNKFIYKYSPFKELSANQIEVCKDIFNTMLTISSSRHLITGDPGTGKGSVAKLLNR